ncbi:TPA: hypothetical protein QCY54_000557 [Bacillus cereus]|nr:hypothetical protein [Bacillus cereus]
MTTITKNEETFIFDANIRESHMSRIEVLEKVKGLLLLPELEMATTQQVADFYEVPMPSIASVLREHRNELELDGYIMKSGKEIKGDLGSLKTHNAKIVGKQGHFLIEVGSEVIRMSNGGNGLYSRRAILRIGMLLRDSAIAKEVRTQLLNIEEKATKEAKVADIDEEIQLQMAVRQALMTGDINALAHASEKLIEFKSRHITEIENKLQEQQTVIKTLAKEEVQYKTPGQILRKLVNRYSVVIHGTIGTNKGWQDLRSHLVNKLEKGINLKSRRTKARRSNPRASYISVIHPGEFKIIIPAMVGICESNGVDVADIMKDA